MLSTKNHLKDNDKYKLKVKKWRKIYHSNPNQRKQEYLY